MTRRLPPAVRLLVAGLVLATSCALSAAEQFKTGDTLDVLVAAKATYREVQIRSIGVRSVMITHRDGMASVLLRELSPELQARFGYDPAAEKAAEAAAAARSPANAVAKNPPRPAKPAPPAAASAFDALVRKFGQPVAPAAEVNLRPKFSELGLGVRDQGSRPSCAVYAIVSALEFQVAQDTGSAANYSEDYLIWATRKTTQRVPNAPLANSTAEAGEDAADEGFVLAEVVTALRAYGVALQDQLPNARRGRFAAIPTPAPEVIETARRQQNVAIHPIPGRDARTRLANIVHALDAGVPIPVGMAWPHWRTAKSGFLSTQKPPPNAWHAVTLVGYRCPSGNLEDTQFIFKNSWGWSWGQGGYGTATYRYLHEHLNDAVVLELVRPTRG